MQCFKHRFPDNFAYCNRVKNVRTPHSHFSVSPLFLRKSPKIKMSFASHCLHHTLKKNGCSLLKTKIKPKSPKNKQAKKQHDIRLFRPKRTVGTELWVYNNFLGHLSRRTVTANLLDGGSDRSSQPLVGSGGTFTSLVALPGQAVTSAFIV